jgi:hypothetical protein
MNRPGHITTARLKRFSRSDAHTLAYACESEAASRSGGSVDDTNLFEGLL